MNPRRFYLSYSGRECYNSCPKKYKFRYIDKISCQSDPRNSFLGSAIGTIFEWFYRDKIWNKKDPKSSAISLIDPAIKKISKDSNFDVTHDRSFYNSLLDDLKFLIPPAIDNIRKHRLLSSNTTVEHKLDVVYKGEEHEFIIGGRADFVHSFTREDVWIVDGKATKKKSADYDQLVWYSIQHYLKYGVLPKRIGFFFYKFPDNPMKWVVLDESLLKSSLKNTEEAVRKINLGLFKASTSGHCYLCDYKNSCEEGSEYIADKKKSNFIDVEDSIFHIDTI
jgi:hypothetical protein